MTSEFSLLPGTRIALFQSEGPISFEERFANLKRIADFCKANEVKQVIVDLSKQRSTAKILQMMKLGSTVPEHLQGIYIALVCHPDDQETFFAETVAANRGAFSKAFTNIKDARSWLEETVAPVEKSSRKK